MEVHQNHEDEKKSKVGSASLLLVGVLINPSDSSEFFEIDQLSEAKLGEKKNSSEFFEQEV
jgi:hypothetical protein